MTNETDFGFRRHLVLQPLGLRWAQAAISEYQQSPFIDQVDTITDGLRFPNFYDEIIKNSLLNPNFGDIDFDALSPQEQILYQRKQEGYQPKIVTLIDVDGVLIQLVGSLLKGDFKGALYPQLPQEAIDFIQTVDSISLLTAIITSRAHSSDIQNLFSLLINKIIYDPIAKHNHTSNFEFTPTIRDQAIEEFIQLSQKDSISVVTQKSAQKIIDQLKDKQIDFMYSIESNRKGAKITKQIAEALEIFTRLIYTNHAKL